MVGAFCVFCALLVVALFYVSPHGKKIRLNGGRQLFYTSSVTRAEVEKLATCLNKAIDKAPDSIGTVQLNKRGDVYEVRMAVADSITEDDFATLMCGLTLSEVAREAFGPAPFEIHLCDRSLKTVRVLTPTSSAP